MLGFIQLIEGENQGGGDQSCDPGDQGDIGLHHRDDCGGLHRVGHIVAGIDQVQSQGRADGAAGLEGQGGERGEEAVTAQAHLPLAVVHRVSEHTVLYRTERAHKGGRAEHQDPEFQTAGGNHVYQKAGNPAEQMACSGGAALAAKNAVQSRHDQDVSRQGARHGDQAEHRHYLGIAQHVGEVIHHHTAAAESNETEGHHHHTDDDDRRVLQQCQQLASDRDLLLVGRRLNPFAALKSGPDGQRQRSQADQRHSRQIAALCAGSVGMAEVQNQLDAQNAGNLRADLAAGQPDRGYPDTLTGTGGEGAMQGAVRHIVAGGHHGYHNIPDTHP